MTKLEERWQLARETIGDGRLSVVMPVYNLGSSIADNLALIAGLFESHRLRTELVPVDDGSADETAERLKAFSFSGEYVVYNPVICSRNGGKGAALRAGFEASHGEYVMLLDGDLDIHPRQTPYFFEAMVKNGADVVCGSKRHPRSVVQYPWHRRLVSWCYFTLVRLFIGLRITDTQTGMKLFRREVLGESLARMLVKTYAFDLELLSIAHQRGARIAEAPVRIKFGSKFGALKVSTVRSMAWDSLAVFYRLRLLDYYARAEAPKKLDHEPLVSIVIACPKPSWMLEECLAGIAAQTYRNFEVIVLPDEPAELGGQQAHDNKLGGESKLRVKATGKVRPAEKRNFGIEMAKGEIVAFIDDDAYPDAHWLEYAVRYFSEPSIGGVGGPGVTPSNDRYLARVGGRVYDNIFVSGNYRYRYKAGGIRRDVDDYPSCNLLVRTDLLRKINGYRTDFWPGEDTLLCKDIIDSGARIVYDPWVVVNHHRRALFGAHLRQLGRYAFHRGYFMKRFPSNSLHLSYFIPSLFSLYLVSAAIAAPLLFVCALPVFALVALAPLALYLALVTLSAASLNPLTWALTVTGVFASHIVYGVEFVRGLCARRAPCEFIGSDHV